MAILVTGATGFVGSSVARKLLERGERVRLMARAGADLRNCLDLDAEMVEGDLLDPDTLTRTVAGCETVYHVAADYRLWVREPTPMYRANVDGSTALVRAAAEAGVRKIVYTSSVAALGLNADGAPSNEDAPVGIDDMIGHYKRSKFLAEQAVRQLAAEGAPVVIVNPSTPIGPRDVKPTPTGKIIVEAATGRMPAFVDTGLNIVHVEDVAEGHLLAAERGKIGERYILGGDDMSLREILARIAALRGRKPPRIELPHGLVTPIAYCAEAWARVAGGEPFATVDGVRMARKKMYFSSEKAKTALGYVSRPAAKAIADAVRWFDESGYLV